MPIKVLFLKISTIFHYIILNDNSCGFRKEIMNNMTKPPVSVTTPVNPPN
jgi:hypothetical protein